MAQGFGIAIVPYMDLLLKLDLKILQIDATDSKENFYGSRSESVYAAGGETISKFVLEHRDFLSGDEAEAI